MISDFASVQLTDRWVSFIFCSFTVFTVSAPEQKVDYLLRVGDSGVEPLIECGFFCFCFFFLGGAFMSMAFAATWRRF